MTVREETVRYNDTLLFFYIYNKKTNKQTMKVELVKIGNFASVAEQLEKYGIPYNMVEGKEAKAKESGREMRQRLHVGLRDSNLFVVDDNGNKTPYRATPLTLILLKKRIESLTKTVTEEVSADAVEVKAEEAPKPKKKSSKKKADESK